MIIEFFICSGFLFAQGSHLLELFICRKLYLALS
jgi:hypothetical protein